MPTVHDTDLSAHSGRRSGRIPTNEPPRSKLPTILALLLVATVWVLGCVWSFTEQTAFAKFHGFVVPELLPLILDGMATALAGVSYAASLDGRPAIGARLGTAIAVGLSATSNGLWAAERSGDNMLTIGLAVVVPCTAMLAFEVLLSELRRQVQRRRGDPAPVRIPYPRMVRWALAPVSTFITWRRLVLELTSVDGPSASEGPETVRTRSTMETGASARTPEDSTAEMAADGAADRAATVRVTTDRAANDPVAGDRLASDRLASDRVTSDRVASDRVTSDRLASDRVAGDDVATGRVAAHPADMDDDTTRTEASSAPDSAEPARFEDPPTAPHVFPDAVRLEQEPDIGDSTTTLTPDDDRVRRVAELLHEGHELTGEQVGDMFACSGRTGRRLIERARQLIDEYPLQTVGDY